MRSIPNRFVAVLLVGCLATAVAVAGEQEGIVASCGGAYANRTPTPKEIATVLRNHQTWVESNGAPDDPRKANLCQANLAGANLQGARLGGADLQDADLLGANLQGVLYEPHPGKLPNFWTLTDSRNHLDTLVFHTSPAGLMALREAFKKAGMRTQERQLTYAIEHIKQLHAWGTTP
jgi:hypothetical protein